METLEAKRNKNYLPVTYMQSLKHPVPLGWVILYKADDKFFLPSLGFLGIHWQL